MAGAGCQLVQRSAMGWLVSLGDGAPVEAGGRSVSGTQYSSFTARAGADPRQAEVGLEEPAYSAPAIAEVASCKVIFDGVVYNRTELSDRFAGSSLPTANDAALILQAYLHWGENVLQKVRGIFALLIWDKQRDVLLCARDPIGVYPLFYADAGRELLFSTSIEVLLRHPRVSDAVNRALLADHLSARHPIPEETFFESINRVRPAHVMKVTGKGRRQEYRYWDPQPDPTMVHWVSGGELEEQFDELLDQAVGRCLQLGQPGIYLSGGFDSVSVAAVAADSSRREGLADPLALSLVFPDPETSEEAVQRRVASDLGLPHVLVSLLEAAGPQGLMASALKMSTGWPVPLQNIWAPAYQHLGLEGKRRGCEVIMTGGGGDEWLGVSPYYAADLLRRLDLGGIYRLYKSYARSNRLPQLALIQHMLWTSGVRPWLGVAGRAFLRRTAPEILRKRRLRYLSKATPDWVAPDSALRQELYQRTMQRYSDPDSRSFYLDVGRLPLDHALSSTDMEEVFEEGRRMGLRVLMPYWDPDLLGFLMRVPPELLNQGGRTKGLVRQTLHRRFPNLGFERQKKIVAVNLLRNMLFEDGAQIWKTMGGTPALAELGIVDAPALEPVMETLLTDPKQEWRDSWRAREVINLELWLRARLQLPLPSAVSDVREPL